MNTAQEQIVEPKGFAAAAHPVPVVVVEDSRNVQSALQDLLAEIGGFEVISLLATESDATAWLYRHKKAWRIAILDLILADGSGFHLIARYRAKANGGKVVVFSDFVTPAIEAKCIGLGADAVFRKTDATAFASYLETVRPKLQ